MRLFIENRKQQKIAVLLEERQKQTGLVFIMHGLGGRKEQLHIATYAEAFREKGFTVVRFDATNSFGESDGDYADATTTNYYEDLEDVIAWAKTQPWYQEPFWLAGHSLGGICTALYAERNSEKVKALAPTSTVVSGELSLETPTYKNHVELEKRGWVQEKHGKKLKSSHIKDRMQYDLLVNASRLTMPVLLVVGDLDKNTPLAHQQLFFDKIPGPKKLFVIKGAEHTFKESHHLAEIRKIFLDWIDSVL